jgi:hypothetical protein
MFQLECSLLLARSKLHLAKNETQPFMLVCAGLHQCEIYEEYTASIFKVKMKQQMMWYVPPKHCYPPTRIHGVTTHFPTSSQP